MNPIIDRMLTVTAEIAEELLAVKDSGLSGIPPEAKLRIIELAEMASQVPEVEPVVPECEEEDNFPTETVIEKGEAPRVEETQEVSAAEEISEVIPAAAYLQQEDEENEELMVMTDDEFVADTSAKDHTCEEEQVFREETNIPDTKLPADIPPVIPDKVSDTPAAVPADLSLWRSLFSINDMFLYRRELFNGNEALMNDALANIGEAGSPDAVRAILADRYGIDLRTRPAKDFIATISSLF